MKPSSIFLTSLLATLATAAPMGQPQKRQMGLSFLSTGVIPASTVAAALSAQATASSAETLLTVASGAITAEATEAVTAEPTATEAASVETTAVELATEMATATSVVAEATATADAAPPAAAPVNLDVVVLNLAFTLEQLEGKFYEEALKKFSLSDMVNAGLNEMQATVIIEEIQGIQRNEAVHATVLSGAIKALGAEPFNGCQFNFGATLADPLTFLSVARTLEAVGVAAYAGAASLISDPALLTAAASILTLEARHQSLLNTFNSGTFAAQSFDIALAPEQILAIAGGFLSNCQASDLGLTANLPLSVTDKSSQSTRFQVGSELAFSSSDDFAVESHFCQMFVGGAPSAVVLEAARCVVPKGIDGPVAVFLTKSSSPLASNLQIQNKADIAFGPGLIFVDGAASSLSTLFQVQNVRDSIASANLGGYYVSRRNGNRGNAKNDNNNYMQAIKVVVQSKTGVAQAVNKVNKGAIKNEQKSSSPSPGSYNYRRTYRKPEKRGNGDVREVRWSMVRRT